MAVARVSVLLFLLFQVRLHRASEDETVKCGGRVWCLAAPSSATHLSGKSEYFYYSPESHGCQRVEAGCAPAANCSFTSRQECHSVCITARAHVIGGCESTKYGCCGDGVTVNDGQNNCPGEAESTASSAGQPSIGVHWGLLASGVCGAVLLLGVVTVVGLSTFAYRKRHRNRQRWYIHEVLQMYDGNGSESDCSSDGSWDDPEHKNLFDRL